MDQKVNVAGLVQRVRAARCAQKAIAAGLAQKDQKVNAAGLGQKD